MKKVNDASMQLAKEDVKLLQKKGELFERAKKRVHEIGYSYAKRSSRSKVFGNRSSESSTVSTKRKYISTTAREERIDELSESVKSVSETIQLLLKQKEQYANVDKFQQAADVNACIMEKMSEKRKLEKELRALQEAREKSRNYKKKKSSHSLRKGDSDSQNQRELSWSESSKSHSSEKSGESSGGDTVVVSDNELIPVSIPKNDQVITIEDGSNWEPENQFDNNARDASSLKKQVGAILAAYNEIVEESTKVPENACAKTAEQPQNF